MSTNELPKPPVAHLDQTKLQKVENVERTLGDVVVVAYERPLVPAKLSAEQVQILQQAERDLGVCLIAYQPGA